MATSRRNYFKWVASNLIDNCVKEFWSIQKQLNFSSSLDGCIKTKVFWVGGTWLERQLYLKKYHLNLNNYRRHLNFFTSVWKHVLHTPHHFGNLVERKCPKKHLTVLKSTHSQHFRTAFGEIPWLWPKKLGPIWVYSMKSLTKSYFLRFFSSFVFFPSPRLIFAT